MTNFSNPASTKHIIAGNTKPSALYGTQHKSKVFSITKSVLENRKQQQPHQQL